MPHHNPSSTLGPLRYWAHRRSLSISGILGRSFSGSQTSTTSIGEPNADRSSRYTVITIKKGKPLSLWTYHYQHDDGVAPVEPSTDPDVASGTGQQSVLSLGNLQYLTMGSPGGDRQILAVPWYDKVGGTEQRIEEDSLVVRGDVSILQIHHRGNKNVTITTQEDQDGKQVTTILWHGGEVSFNGTVTEHYAQTVKAAAPSSAPVQDQNVDDIHAGGQSLSVEDPRP